MCAPLSGNDTNLLLVVANVQSDFLFLCETYNKRRQKTLHFYRQSFVTLIHKLYYCKLYQVGKLKSLSYNTVESCGRSTLHDA